MRHKRAWGYESLFSLAEISQQSSSLQSNEHTIPSLRAKECRAAPPARRSLWISNQVTAEALGRKGSAEVLGSGFLRHSWCPRRLCGEVVFATVQTGPAAGRAGARLSRAPRVPEMV